MPVFFSRLRRISLRSRSASYEPARHARDELAALLLPAGREVLEHAAHLDVARVHALPGRELEQVEHHLAVAQRPPQHRDRADVEQSRRGPEQVRRDAVQLHVDHAQRLRARRHLDVEQTLDAHREDRRVEVVREVVHPLDERDDLPVLLVLARLLDAGVDVADDRHHVAHDLALERAEQAQDAVRGGVVRPDVDREELGLRVELGALDRILDVVEAFHSHRALALAVGNRERVSHTSAGADARCR